VPSLDRTVQYLTTSYETLRSLGAQHH